MAKKIDFFIGPCVLEDEPLVREVAAKLKQGLSKFQDRINLYFKGSFDKANRTSIDSYRGPGLSEGLRLLSLVKKDFALPVVTDFHLPEQAKLLAPTVDVLQVPAFLCRQTDMIAEGARACAEHGRILKIKKGQFLSAQECKNIVDKAKTFLPLEQIMLTERGNSFGYNNLIVDMSSFQVMKSFGVRAIYDATHAVQMPGALGKATGGKRENIVVLALAAAAAGADGIFMETHPRPDQAKSDPATSLPLEEIPGIVERILKIHQATL